MDELQDAIEDAQYVNAIACVDEGPRPMLPWEFPTEEQLLKWKETKNTELSKLIAEGRRTRRRSSYSRLNVDRAKAGLTSSLVKQDETNMQKSLEAAAAAAAADFKDEEEPQKLENGATKVKGADEVTSKITFEEKKPPTTMETPTIVPSLKGTRLKVVPLEAYEYVSAQPLGFFLFAQYVKDKRNDYLRMNFVEDAILYRRVRGSHHREHRAKDIALTYLVDKTNTNSEIEESRRLSGLSLFQTEEQQNESTPKTGNPPTNGNEPSTTPGGGVRDSGATTTISTSISSSRKKTTKKYAKNSSHASDDISILNMDKELVIQEPPNDPVMCNIPQKKDIVEYDLARLEELSLKKLGHNEDELQSLLDQNLDLGNNSRSLIQVKMDGPALRRALKRCGIPYICPAKKSSISPDRKKTSDAPSEEGLDSANKLETAPVNRETENEAEPQSEPDVVANDNDAEDETNPVDVSTDSNRKDSMVTAQSEADAAAAVNDEIEELRVSGDRDLFDELELIVMEGLQKQYWADFLESSEYEKLLKFWWYRDRKVVEDDFFLMRVLGRGGFGLVHACKKGTSGKLFAMKVMNKKRIKLKKSEQLTVNERMALAAVDSPFVVKLSYAFQSKDDIFLILDLMTGGDLGFHLHQKGKFSKRECLYFSARIMLGLQAIHDRRFVYRDLKPENVLVGDDGRVKLSDLGLATKVTPTLHGAAGTRGYWAPEMLRRDHKGRRKAYGHTVDWFSFGCCLYEFISGFNPFRSQDALRFGMKEGMDSKEKALDCATLKMEPSFDPARFDHDAADLCLKLLDKNEKTRLGAKGCQEIMAHPYYRDMNWEAIISDRMKPPFIPRKDVNAASQSEIGTFAEDRTYHETQLEAEDEEIYKYWDWTNPTAFDAEVIEFLIHERRSGKPLVPTDPMTPCCCVVL